jgi:hypothetical protein
MTKQWKGTLGGESYTLELNKPAWHEIIFDAWLTRKGKVAARLFTVTFERPSPRKTHNSQAARGG